MTILSLPPISPQNAGVTAVGCLKGGDLELSFNHSVPIVVCAPSQTQGKEAFKETGEMAHGNSASEFSSLLMKCFLKIFFLPFYLFAWGVCTAHVKIRGQLTRLSYLTLYGFQELNLHCQAWLQAPFPAEPAHWPSCRYLQAFLH